MFTELKLTLSDTGAPIALFPITFETKHHTISYPTFSKSCRGVASVFQSADAALFGVQTDVELYLGAFEQGSFRGWFGQKATWAVGGAALWAASQFADGFLTGLTGKTVSEWGEVSAQMLKDADFSTSDFDELLAHFAPQIISAEVCSLLLSASEDRFEEIISERPQAAESAIDGRLRFYEACRSDKEIPSVRFGSLSGGITVKRGEFGSRGKRQLVDALLSVDTKSGNWRFAELSIVVTSPTWEPNDQQRHWKGKLPDGKYIFFEIEDSRFWKLVIDRELRTDTPDIMRAQFFYEDVNGRYKSARAMRVLEFNGQIISIGLATVQIEEKLTELNSSSNIQDELFAIKGIAPKP